MLLSKFMYFIHLHHICGINRQIGVSQGSMSQSRQGTPSVTATCLVSSFFCQPHNLMYLRVALIDFNETWSQWSMTQPAYVIWPLTGSKVIQGHGGQKGHFSPKTHQVLRIIQHGPVTYVCSSPWPTLQMLLDHFFIWGHLGSQGSNIRSESKYL